MVIDLKEKIVLIDGHSILNRAFYGIPDLTNHQGLHTNAVYGFLNILFKLLEEEKPQFLVVAFDEKAPTFRHTMYAAYKGTRKGMPDELREQVPLMKEVLTAMGVAILSKEGYEADDILGTIAKNFESQGYAVTLVSGDRDLLQIASKHIKIQIPKTKGGKTESYHYYEDDVYKEYHLTTKQFIELKALMGDTADNIPGVPKVGLKTATELLERYGTIDGIYEHIEEVTKKSIKASLLEHRALAELSKELATIKTDCQLPDVKEKARITNLYTPQAYEQFKRLGFKNYLQRFEQMEEIQERTRAYHWIQSYDAMVELLGEARTHNQIALELLYEEQDSGEVYGVALSWDCNTAYGFKVGEELTLEMIRSSVRELVMQIQAIEQGNPIVVFEVKKLYEYFELHSAKKLYDLQIAFYLVNPLQSEYTIDDMVSGYLTKYHEVRTQIEAYQMTSLMEEIEMPVSYVLYQMEQEGIAVEKDALKEYGEQLVDRIQALEQAIYESCETTFNINSPKQLGVVLFEQMALPGGKKTKTGYSTAAEVLEKLAPEYQVIRDILEYRGLTKLKSTYAEGLSHCIGADGRIHSHFNQTITATGRISSTEPNLQNIPMRMELGRLIRKVFVPKEGYVFMDADYSQIELRILAHMSGDEKLIQAYGENEDIHRLTASQVFHTPFAEVTDLQRRNAKAVNFGIIYGISAFGLSQDLSISPKEAGEYREQYFATYPKVKEFLDGLITMAKEEGAISTLLGRRRPIPEMNASNFMQRSFGERVAMNSPIQGTAADIIKVAMLRVYEALQCRQLKSKLILQIHDELLLEVAKDEIEEVTKILEGEMKGAMDLSVSLEVESHIGSNWYDVK